MRYLDRRIQLDEKEKFRYLNLEKGYEGELKFDQLTEKIQENRLILNDLLLEVNSSYFQIDSLIISQGIIHLIDIKNYEGDYYLESDKLYSVKTKSEYKNPLDQLKRCETLMYQLLRNLKYTSLIKSSVIFINPEFTLYQAPLDQPIVFPSQINRFIHTINKTPSNLTSMDKNLAHKLISLHYPKNKFYTLPSYEYEDLQKGVYCNICNSLLVLIKNQDFVCGICDAHEKLSSAILRNVKEFQLLFPEQKITTNKIHHWCNMSINKKTVRRVLKKHMTAVGKTKDMYYQPIDK